MKKIVFIIIATLLLIFPMALTYAEASESHNAENSDEESDREQTPVENHTLPSRVVDTVMNNYQTVISLVGYGVLFFVSKRNEKKSKDRNSSQNVLLNSIAQNTTKTSANQSAVTNVFNTVAEGFNSFVESSEKLTRGYSEMKTSEDANNVRLHCLETKVDTLLEIITSAYSGNKNLPQGVKDIISLKYADCLKSKRLLVESGAAAETTPILMGGGESGD